EPLLPVHARRAESSARIDAHHVARRALHGPRELARKREQCVHKRRLLEYRSLIPKMRGLDGRDNRPNGQVESLAPREIVHETRGCRRRVDVWRSFAHCSLCSPTTWWTPSPTHGRPT